jgi:hypothetical protein
VKLYDAAGTTVLWSEEVADALLTRTIPYVLANSTSYKLGVALRDGDGLWSTEAINPFSVSFTPPSTPTFVATYNAITGSTAITITNPASSPAAVSNDLYRDPGTGVYELVATGIAAQGTVTDWIPNVSGTNRYYIVAWSALPSSAQSTVSNVVTTTDDQVRFNGGPGYAQQVTAGYNPSIGDSFGRQRVTHQFAGRANPVAYDGVAVPRVVNISAVYTDPAITPALVALFELPGPFFYRDPLGRRFAFSPSGVSVNESPGNPRTLTLTATRVDAT